MPDLKPLFETALPENMKYSGKMTSLSPFFSNIGMSFDPCIGIQGLWLHYNRHSALLGEPFLFLDGEWQLRESAHFLDCVSQKAFGPGGEVQLQTTFFGQDDFGVDLKRGVASALNPQRVWINPLHELGKNHISQQISPSTVAFKIEVPTSDPRDPDWSYIAELEVTASCGGLSVVQRPLSAPVPPVNRRIHSWLAWDIPVGVEEGRLRVKVRLPESKVEHSNSVSSTADWWRSQLQGLPAGGRTPCERELELQAAIILLSNSANAPGRLEGLTATFPSRGRYPTHYFWDTFFHNLGFMGWRNDLAADGFRLLFRSLDSEGKVPQFICSTWMRPGSTQSALLGWGVRLLLQAGVKDQEFVKEAATALEANSRWWLRHRVRNDHGVVDCEDPFEVWDDTPRLDEGPIEIIDQNVFLAIQMEVLAELLAMLGREPESRSWLEERGLLVERIRQRFFSAADLCFFDRNRDTGAFVRVLTPASFLPLLLPEFSALAPESIRRHLINPSAFFGDVPFPCVAYNDPKHVPEGWWRGPTWPPIAWFMLEVLERHGFMQEADQARKRFLSVIQRDALFHELFNAATGEGLGALQQGWTAAVFLNLLRRENASS